jgi:N-acetylglucosamine-6-phosphate deacetylase
MLNNASLPDGWVVADALFDGRALTVGGADGQRSGDLGVKIQNGHLTAVGTPPENAPVTRLTGTLCPGFFDIQINGGGGVLFNSDPTEKGLSTVAQAHKAGGTHHWLPTVITDAPAVLAACCDGAARSYGRHGVAGIHIEGPHIALARKGTHLGQWVRPFQSETLNHVARLRHRGIPVLITLAPEAVQPGDIRRLVGVGAVVALGHTNATAEQVETALEEGAALFTHLFNAMSQMENRAPGAVGAAITSDAFCSMIADGYHVDDRMLSIAIRARPEPDRMILVSDAMPTVGGPDQFSLYGQDIQLQNGRLINAQGSLAGAHVTMMQSVAHAVDKLGCSLQEALKMATSTPATLMGLADKIGGLHVGQPADLLVISDDLTSCKSLTF